MLRRLSLTAVLILLVSAAAHAQATGWRTFYSKESKVGLRFPAKWQLDDAKKPSDDEPGFTVLASVTAPDSSLRGQVHQAEAAISVAAISAEQCRVFTIPSAGEETKPVRLKVGAITYYKASGSDAGAGSVGETDIYRTFHAGECYEVRLTIVRRNTPKPSSAVKQMQSQLDAIMRTVYFGK